MKKKTKNEKKKEFYASVVLKLSSVKSLLLLPTESTFLFFIYIYPPSFLSLPAFFVSTIILDDEAGNGEDATEIQSATDPPVF